LVSRWIAAVQPINVVVLHPLCFAAFSSGGELCAAGCVLAVEVARARRGLPVRRQLLSPVGTVQVPDTVLERLRRTREPHDLTGGRDSEAEPNKVVVTRAALAAPFVATVRRLEFPPEELAGALSWVAVGLDGQARRDRTFLDVGADAARAEAQLEGRIDALDAAPPGKGQAGS
jgi:hypothetical protein